MRLHTDDYEKAREATPDDAPATPTQAQMRALKQFIKAETIRLEGLGIQPELHDIRDAKREAERNGAAIWRQYRNTDWVDAAKEFLADEAEKRAARLAAKGGI